MNPFRALKISAATAVCAAAAAQSALAGGEPKNTAPFISQATAGRSPAAAVITASAIAHARAATVGESKQGLPFTRHFEDADALARFLGRTPRPTTAESLGEPKSQLPFTLLVAQGA